MTVDDLQLIATTIRTLSMDAIQCASSGHPGMAMGCADIMAVLWGKIMVHNPDDPGWINRDRFVLSAGHGSMLLYSVLHFFGYGVTLGDIKNFRQLGSITPGHPEHQVTRGVETTTGPLGQGFGNAVGMAFARDMLAREFNTPGSAVIDHYVYAVVSDGDIMEGISAEAASLAGHMGLGRLIYIYDSNDITIEGSTELTFSEDVAMRFEACRWHVQTIDGHDFDAIEGAILKAQKVSDRPSIIIARTTLAKGSASMEGCKEAHGAPLGDKEVFTSKEHMGCCGDDTFLVPERVYRLFEERKVLLKQEYDRWQSLFSGQITGAKKKQWDAFFSIPERGELRKKLPLFEADKAVATRSASGRVLQALFKELPGVIGGSADLGPSNNSLIAGFDETGKNRIGRNIHFGIREHAMGAVQNGIAYYGGFIPYSATFFSFMDYMRPPIRIAAIGRLHTVYIFTHDSIFVGEDGPTHQPVEHLCAARAIPNLDVIRPADAEETKEAWLQAVAKTDGPTMLVLSRQNLPILKRTPGNSAELLARGAYVIRQGGDKPDIIVLSSGSEVHVAIEAADLMEKDGIAARVVSFPSWELFDRQPEEYRRSVLGHGTPKAVVEAGTRMGWEKYAGNHGLFITVEGFGRSAPCGVLADYYGLTPRKITDRIAGYLKQKPGDDN